MKTRMPLSADEAELDVGADLFEVRRLAAFLRDKAEAAGIDEMIVMDLELALVEAANNVVEHGFAGRDDGRMCLRVELSSDQVRLILTDRGRPAPDGFFAAPRAFEIDAVDGRGNAIILGCVDSVDYRTIDGVNQLTLLKHR